MEKNNLFDLWVEVELQSQELIKQLLEKDMSSYVEEINSLLTEWYPLLDKFFQNLDLKDLFQKAEVWFVKAESGFQGFLNQTDLNWAEDILNNILELLKSIHSLFKAQDLSNLINQLFSKLIYGIR